MPMTIAFQGEIGAFSEEAALALFPNAKLAPYPSFETVFEALAAGKVDHSVVPIENSLHGSVHANYDLLREHEVHITGELQLRIRHHLMARKGTRPEEITRVHSHPQALGQCREYLRTMLPGAEIVPAYDTAGAAKMIAGRGTDPSPGTGPTVVDAAIASRRAAVEYGLEILAEGIESNHRNYTRFLALSRGPATAAPTSLPAGGNMLSCKTSVVYAPRENVPGALFKSLAVFALRDIDLFKIESRPLIGSVGQYLFYLDLAGSARDESVRRALDHLGELSAWVRVLGSYPRGSTVG